MNPISERPAPKLYRKAAFTDAAFTQLEDCEFYTIEMQYPLLHMQNAVNRCLVRGAVRERLTAAAKLLPPGFRLKIWDAWRPFALQKELYHVYAEQITEQFGLAGRPEEEIRGIIRQYVSEPADDRTLPPVHTTGGAVDVTVIDGNGRELDMGTAFDAFSEKTATAWFEAQGDSTVRENRRLLYGVMRQAGFTNLPSEWWHYDYGDRFWAYYQNRPAKYKGIFTEEEVHE